MGLSLVIFLVVTAGVFLGYQALAGLLFPDASLVRQRMAAEFGGQELESAGKSPLFKNLDQLNLTPASSGITDLELASLAATPVSSGGLRTRLETMLQQADLRLTVRQILLIAAGLGLGLGLLGTVAHGPVLGLCAAAAGSASPMLYLHHLGKRRREKILNQLPGAFELMARVLRAGHSVPQALQAVGESFEPPIAAEFARCLKQQNLGLRPEVSFQEMAQRLGILELRIFVMAMLIQRQTGGNLSDVLERLGMLIRSRQRLRTQVRTLTAEGRLQGLTLLCLPFVIFGAMMVVNRSYAETLFEHTSLLAATGVSMLAGVFWIRSIVNFEI